MFIIFYMLMTCTVGASAHVCGQNQEYGLPVGHGKCNVGGILASSGRWPLHFDSKQV